MLFMQLERTMMMKPSSVLAHIVAAADALSGARPGEKSDDESYVSRLTDIEEIVNSFEGYLSLTRFLVVVKYEFLLKMIVLTMKKR